MQEAQRALTLTRRLQDHWLETKVLDGIAAAAFYRGDLWNAYRSWNKALEFCRALDDHYEICRLKSNLGDVCRHLGAYPQARQLQTELTMRGHFSNFVDIQEGAAYSQPLRIERLASKLDVPNKVNRRKKRAAQVQRGTCVANDLLKLKGGLKV